MGGHKDKRRATEPGQLLSYGAISLVQCKSETQTKGHISRRTNCTVSPIKVRYKIQCNLTWLTIGIAAWLDRSRCLFDQSLFMHHIIIAQAHLGTANVYRLSFSQCTIGGVCGICLYLTIYVSPPIF